MNDRTEQLNRIFFLNSRDSMIAALQTRQSNIWHYRFDWDELPAPEKVALGHALFFDKRMSVDGTLACYSCHQNEDGNGGHDPVAMGAGGNPYACGDGGGKGRRVASCACFSHHSLSTGAVE